MTEWTTGFCCFLSGEDPCLTSMKGFLCPCFLYAETKHQIHGNNEIVSCCSYFCCMFFGCQCCLTCEERKEITNFMSIDENPCMACVGNYCFPCCSLVQMENETPRILAEQTRNSQEALISHGNPSQMSGATDYIDYRQNQFNNKMY